MSSSNPNNHNTGDLILLSPRQSLLSNSKIQQAAYSSFLSPPRARLYDGISHHGLPHFHHLRLAALFGIICLSIVGPSPIDILRFQGCVSSSALSHRLVLLSRFTSPRFFLSSGLHASPQSSPLLINTESCTILTPSGYVDCYNSPPWPMERLLMY